MKLRIVILFAVLISLELSVQICEAQTHHGGELLEEGIQYFSNEQFSLAIDFFLQAKETLDDHPRVDYLLAECYRRTFQYRFAESHYFKVCNSNDASRFPLALYYYSLMLKHNGDFERSSAYFTDFINRHNDRDITLKDVVEQAMVDRAGNEMAIERMATKRATEFALTATEFNSPHNDYALAFCDTGKLVITSGRLVSNRNLIDERFGEAFSDNYYFEQSSQGWMDRTKEVFKIMNSRFNDGSGSFNSKGNKYYFTVCGAADSFCKIFYSSFLNGKWNEPQQLNGNVNVNNFDSKHPVISVTGDTLFFTSNRIGGAGNFDIWFCVNAGNENWGPAINLGRGVNTDRNELSPAIGPLSNILFFASDGHEGYGGLDLYMAKRMSSGDTLIYNLDYPFNTTYDDCFITLQAKSVYWSSNREGGLGGFDIYRTNILSKISFVSKVSLKKSSKRLLQKKHWAETSNVLNLVASRYEERIDYQSLTYEKKKVVDHMVRTQLDGLSLPEGLFGLSPDEYRQLFEVAKRRIQDFSVRGKDRMRLTRVETLADSLKDVMIVGILMDSATGEKFANVKIVLLDDHGQILKVTRTNDEGRFRFSDVPSPANLILSLENSWQEVDTLPVVTELKIITALESSMLYAENIYFDFDQFYIRPEAGKVLDELASYLKSNPEVQVEIFAFADDLGSVEYNLYLTQRRGQSVVDYLIRQGVDETSLAIIPKGKQDKMQTNLERQYHRRVEFYLNGGDHKLQAATKTYILKKQVNWSVISKATGISEEKLKSLNASSSPFVKRFQPIRVPREVKLVSEALFFIGI